MKDQTKIFDKIEDISMIIVFGILLVLPIGLLIYDMIKLIIN